MRPHVEVRVIAEDELDSFTVEHRAEVREDGTFTPVPELLIAAFATAISQSVHHEREARKR